MNKEYWNNPEIEKGKAYWIENANDMKLQNFLGSETNLLRCFNDALIFAAEKFGDIRGNVLDVGAGVGWTSAIISRLPEVEKVTAVDCSEHRLGKIAPIVFEQMKGDIRKFNPVVGEFIPENFRIRSFDYIVFCQALYMFPFLYRTVRDVSRLLVPGGVLMVAAERITSEDSVWSLKYIKRIIRNFFKSRADDTGNMYYTDREYRKSIERSGLDYSFQALEYPVYPKTGGIYAGNHFGIKPNQEIKENTYDTCGETFDRRG